MTDAKIPTIHEETDKEEWEDVTDSEEESSPRNPPKQRRKYPYKLPEKVRKNIRDFVKVSPWLRLVAKLLNTALAEKYRLLLVEAHASWEDRFPVPAYFRLFKD